MKNLLMVAAVAGVGVGAGWAQNPVEKPGGTIDLPSSKEIHGVVPGGPRKLSSLPVTMAVSPDGRYVVTVNDGYGSSESGYDQALAVLDTKTGKVTDFADPRTPQNSRQVLFSGLAFSPDGKTLYGTIVSLTDPTGKNGNDTGSGVQVYGFDDGKITRERVMKIAPPQLAPGRTTQLVGGGRAGGSFGDAAAGADHTKGLPYPAAVAVVEGRDQGSGVRDQGTRLLVAGNLSDDVWLMDAGTGAVTARFDLSETDVVPSVYPVALAVAKDGRRAFVALWNGSEVVELDLVKGTVGRKLALLKNQDPVRPGSHPDALVLSPDGKTLYVALGNRDSVAAIDVAAEGEQAKKTTQRAQSSREDREGSFSLKGYYDTRLPGQSFFGAEPEALALNADGSRLYVANLGTDSIAVINTSSLTRRVAAKGMVEPIGFLPTEWLPTGVAFSGGQVYIATGKGTGTGPNNFPQQPGPGMPRPRDFAYIATLLHGSVASLDEKTVERDLHALTAETLEDERLRAGQEKINWDPAVVAKIPKAKEPGMGARVRADLEDVAEPSHPTPTGKDRPLGPPDRDESAMNGARRVVPGMAGPIKHVIYIIRENRTYDQELGDLGVGNGDASLAMYGQAVTPNLHKLAMQFGVLDNFYDSAEVSGDGHVWSNTAIGTDYLERTWQLNYRGGQHGYDFEGVVSSGLPLEQKIPDVNEPGSGYIWGNLAKHGMTLYHFGEFISSTFCNERRGGGAQADSKQGPMLEGTPCSARNEVKPGEKLPEVWGGGVNKWPWAIPLIASNKPTKPELVGHFAPEAPDFNLRIPDQIREDIFEKHLAGWIADKQAGKDTMPNFIMLRLPNDHTAGTAPGGPTPKSSVADNDLAVGRAVEAISHSPFWDDTAFFILEDDAQNGADHVDAHRSIGLIVSKYAPHALGAPAFVDSRFYSTVSMVRTMETVLGLPPMNNNDALSSLIGSVFTGPGDQAPYTADRTNEANGLIFAANPPGARGGRQSAMMDFTHADRADSQKLNVILWQDAMGDQPVPAMLLVKHKKNKGDDDDK